MGNRSTGNKNNGDLNFFVSENKQTGPFVSLDGCLKVAPGTNVGAGVTAQDKKVNSVSGSVTQRVGDSGQVTVNGTKYLQGGPSTSTTYSQALSNNSSFFVNHSKPSQGPSTVQGGFRMTF